MYVESSSRESDLEVHRHVRSRGPSACLVTIAMSYMELWLHSSDIVLYRQQLLKNARVLQRIPNIII